MSESNKNIIFLIPSLSYGGAEVMMVQQIRWLVNNAWNVFVGVLSRQTEDDFFKVLNLPKDHIFCTTGEHAVLNGSAIGFAIKHHRALHTFIAKNEIGVVVANMPLSHLWGRLVKLSNFSLRLIIYHHATQYRANPLNTFSKVIFNKLHMALAKNTDNLTICISDAVEKDIAAHFTIQNGHVLFNSIENRQSEIEGSIEKKERTTKGQTINMIIPGRLHPVKGHLFFLKVFDQMKRQGILKERPATLKIAGGGPLEKEIIAFIKARHLEDCVSITGAVENKTILEHMYTADLVVVPSLEEGLGIVAIESLMLGKTVISSDAGGLKEVIRNGENGYLFRSNDEEDCLRCCTEIISGLPHTLLPKEDLNKDYQQRFSFDQHMCSLVGLIRSLN